MVLTTVDSFRLSFVWYHEETPTQRSLTALLVKFNEVKAEKDHSLTHFCRRAPHTTKLRTKNDNLIMFRNAEFVPN